MKTEQTAKEKYFNFPIQLLHGFMDDYKGVLTNIFDYAVYNHSLKLDGTESERWKSALKFFCVEGSGLQNGKKLVNDFPRNSPYVGINIRVYFDFYQNHKDDFEKACLLAYLALKSILKDKPYACIGNKYLLARMDGKPCAVKDYNELSPAIFKYANEYQSKKLKQALSESWKLVTYSYRMRGFYVSFTLTLNELTFYAEKTRKKYKDQKAKMERNLARTEALRRLYELENLNK